MNIQLPGAIGPIALVICGCCVLVLLGGIILPFIGALVDILSSVLDMIASLITAGPIGWLGCLLMVAACGGLALVVAVLGGVALHAIQTPP